MSTALRPARAPSLLQRLQALDPPLLPLGAYLEFVATDRIGGGVVCSSPQCVRSRKKYGLCELHAARRLSPALSTSGLEPDLPGPDRLSLVGLPEQLRWEVAYGLRRAAQTSTTAASFAVLHAMVATLRGKETQSLLDLDELTWTSRGRQPTKLRQELVVFLIDELDAFNGSISPEAEFTRDYWRLRRLGVTGRGGSWIFDFTSVTQPWLREAVKRFLRWRIAMEHSSSGMHRDLLTLTRLSQALTDTAGPHARIDQFTRAAVDRLLTLLREEGLTANGRSIALSSLKVFFSMTRQHDWIPGLAAQVALYPDDMPRRTVLAPRALSEFVMAQLEDPSNLERLPDARYRLLMTLLMQTGLRQKDARLLPMDCLVADAEQAPYLRYFNHKMSREALVPISPDLATAVLERRQDLTQRHPGAEHLFAEVASPRQIHTTAPTQAQLGIVLADWLIACGVRDEAGQPAHVTPHQFRHTLGTRLINNDVPQDVVRQLLDHTSSEMTAHYARLHDTTVRKHWERARKVDIEGRSVTIPDDSPLADAAWMHHHLGRATMALPNGYCGLPLQQSCPHANACLTCPVFITTPDFLDQHREQLAHTQQVLEGAKSRNQLRLIEINQRVSDNLTTIITALEAEDLDAR